MKVFKDQNVFLIPNNGGDSKLHSYYPAVMINVTNICTYVRTLSLEKQNNLGIDDLCYKKLGNKEHLGWLEIVYIKNLIPIDMFLANIPSSDCHLKFAKKYIGIKFFYKLSQAILNVVPCS